MRAVVFDMDDTLYPELEFVKSGFRAVAERLEAEHAVPARQSVERMWHLLASCGRGRVFDDLLLGLRLHTGDLVQSLISTYRFHQPSIQLYSDAVPLFGQLRGRGFKLGLVTDGLARVQQRKIDALRLASHLDAVLCTDTLGRGYWKPSPVPFQMILERLGVSPYEAIYVGDDPSKDFQGPASLGMQTIQVTLPGQNLAQRATPLRDVAPATFRVSRLADIAHVVERSMT